MANNQALQILRADSKYDFSKSENRLLDGQLVYSKQNKQLYIGDTTNYTFEKDEDIYVNRLCDILPIGAANLVPTYSAGIRQLTSIKENESYKIGKASIALGNDTKAPGDYSLVFGKNSESSAQFTLAGGYNSKAKYYNSIAIGDNVSTSAANQIVFGSYNIDNSNASFIIGNGSIEESSNLLEFGSDNSTLYSTTLKLQSKASSDPYLTIGQVTVEDEEDPNNTKMITEAKFTGNAISANVTCGNINFFKCGGIQRVDTKNVDGTTISCATFYGDSDRTFGITAINNNQINFQSISDSSDIYFNYRKLGNNDNAFNAFKFCDGTERANSYADIYAKDLIFNDLNICEDENCSKQHNLSNVIGKIAIDGTYYPIEVSDDINNIGTDNVITLIVPSSNSN